MSLFDLTGKTALITGASSGLGAQIARTLSFAGARVLLAARRIDKLKLLAKELKNAVAIEIDVSCKKSVCQVFENLEQENKKIDICINNAGIAKLTPLFESDDEDNFESVMQTNVIGIWYIIQQVANHMKNHSIKGSIINIGSVNGAALPSAIGSSYSASKAAVMHLTKALVGELSPYNIRINAISPGFFPTDMTRGFLEKLGAETLEKKIPLGFLADLSDMDGSVLYLASNKASRYVTGTVLTIDGGISWGGW